MDSLVWLAIIVFVLPAPALLFALYMIAPGRPRPLRRWAAPREAFRRRAPTLLGGWFGWPLAITALSSATLAQHGVAKSDVLAGMTLLVGLLLISAGIGVLAFRFSRSLHGAYAIGMITWACLTVTLICAVIDIWTAPAALLASAVIWNLVAIMTVRQTESPTRNALFTRD